MSSTRFSVRSVYTGLAAVFCMLAAAGSASAREVIFVGEAAPLNLYPTYTASEGGDIAVAQPAAVRDLHVLGLVRPEEGAQQFVPVLAATDDLDWLIGYVSAEELAEKVPAVDQSELPVLTAWTDIEQGASGDFVYTAQECLMEESLLLGPPDGKLGPNTSGAISSFQEANGLPVTGRLDLFTYLYLLEKTSSEGYIEASYPPVYSVEEKFAGIIDDVEDPSVLEPYTDPGWTLTYDAFEGEGYIENGSVLGRFEDSSRPIDAIVIELSYAVKVRRNDEGTISVYPVFVARSAGASRPYVQELILKAGNAVCRLGDAVSTGTVSGMEVRETTDIPADPEALAALSGSGDKPLEIRLKGVSRDYDLISHAGVDAVL